MQEKQTIKIDSSALDANKQLLSGILGLQSLPHITALNSILQIFFNIDLFKHHIFYIQKSSVTNITAALEFQQIFLQLESKSKPAPSARQIPIKMGLSLETIQGLNDVFFYFSKIAQLFSVDTLFTNMFISRALKNGKTVSFGSITINLPYTDDELPSLLLHVFPEPVVEYLSPIVTIHIERQKDCTCTLAIPYKLSLKPLMPTDKNKDYVLYGSIVRSGPYPEHPHYYTFLWDFHREQWCLYNDTVVRIASMNEVFEQSQGGKGRSTYSQMLFYVDEAYQSVLFEAGSEFSLPKWILEKACKRTKASNEPESKTWRVNLVRADDISQYVEEEMEIKFTSGSNISITQRATISDLYKEISKCIEKPVQAIAIWIIMHSVPTLRLTHDYDKEFLSHIIDPNKPLQIYIDESIDYSTTKSKPSPLRVFLFFYNYSSPTPLSFLSTASLEMSDHISNLFKIAKSHILSTSGFDILAFQLIDSKTYLIPDPNITARDLLLNNGAIIILQPKPDSINLSSIKPKKPISSHHILTYLNDYLQYLPSLFNIFFDAINDVYLLPIHYYEADKMISFPKTLQYSIFIDFILKAFNLKIDQTTETILLYGKNSTRPLPIDPNFPIAEQLAQLGPESAEICFYSIPLNLLARYRASIRIHFKTINHNTNLTSRKTKSLDYVEFYDDHLTMMDIVNDQKKISTEIENYFIVPVDKNRRVIRENQRINSIRNPVYLYLQNRNDYFLKIVLIVPEKPNKELEIPVRLQDSFSTFKKAFFGLSPTDFSYCYYIKDSEKVEIHDDQTIQEIYNLNRLIYLEMNGTIQFPKNVIIRPADSNIQDYSYKTQYFPGKNIAATDEPDGPTPQLSSRPEDMNFHPPSLNWKDNSLLILDQYSPNVLRPGDLPRIESEMKDCLALNQYRSLILPADPQWPINCFTTILPTIGSMSSIINPILNPVDIVSRLNIDFKTKKYFNKNLKRNFIKVKERQNLKPAKLQGSNEFKQQKDDESDLSFDFSSKAANYPTSDDEKTLDENTYNYDDDTFVPKTLKPKKKKTTQKSQNNHSSAQWALHRIVFDNLLKFDQDPRILEDLSSSDFNVHNDNYVNKAILKEAIFSSLISDEFNEMQKEPLSVQINGISSHSTTPSLPSIPQVSMQTPKGSDALLTVAPSTPQNNVTLPILNSTNDSSTSKKPANLNTARMILDKGNQPVPRKLPTPQSPLYDFTRPNNLIDTPKSFHIYRLQPNMHLSKTNASMLLEFPSKPFMPPVVMLLPTHEPELARLKVDKQDSNPKSNDS